MLGCHSTSSTAACYLTFVEGVAVAEAEALKAEEGPGPDPVRGQALLIDLGGLVREGGLGQDLGRGRLTVTAADVSPVLEKGQGTSTRL